MKNCTFENNKDAAIGTSTVIVRTNFTGNTLKNNGINGFYVSGTDSFTTEEAECTLYNNDGMPFVLDNNVHAHCDLHIQKGTIIKFLKKGNLATSSRKNEEGKWINSTIDTHGTADEPVVFTSIYDDSYGGDTNNDGDATKPAKGDWDKVLILNGQGEFEHTIMKYGGGTGGSMLNYWNGASGWVKGCELKYSSGNGLRTNSTIEIENSVLSDNDKAGLHTTADSISILNNIIENNEENGISVHGGRGIDMRGNTINNNKGNAVYVWGAVLDKAWTENTVKGNGLNGVVVRSISTYYPSTFYSLETMPYVLENDLVTYFRLKIKPGVIIKMKEDAGLYTGNTSKIKTRGLIFEGTEEQPIIFTSIHDDTYGGDTENDGNETLPQAGDWEQIKCTKDTAVFKHCVFRYGGGEYNDFSSEPMLLIDGLEEHTTQDNDTAIVENCTFEHSTGKGIEVSLVSPKINNCHFSSNKVGIDIRDLYDAWNPERRYACSITNNIIENSEKQGISISSSASSVLVKNNKVRYNGGTGIDISAGSENWLAEENLFLDIKDNTVENNNGEAVVLRNTPVNRPWTGNSIKGNQVDGISLYRISDSAPNTLYKLGETIPYVIKKNIITNQQLTIKPGTIIKFDKEKRIKSTSDNTKGGVIFEGTAKEPIVFTSLLDDTYGGDTNSDGDKTEPKPGDWDGISCYADTAVLKHCIIKYGGIIGDYYPFTVYITEMIEDLGEADEDTVVIDHCVFDHCYDTGLYINGENAQITNSRFSNNKSGCKIKDGRFNPHNETLALINNNQFENNKEVGLYLYSKAYVTDNLIENNTVGVFIESQKEVSLGSNTTDSIGGNTFKNNTEYHIKNYTVRSVKAIMNSWSEKTAEEIDAKIWDNEERKGTGEVIFEPWYDCTPKKPIISDDAVTSICLGTDSDNTYSYQSDKVDKEVTYTWELIPKDAGELTYTENKAEVKWSETFNGTARLLVYRENDCGKGPTSDTLSIEVHPYAQKPTITANKNVLTASQSTHYQWYKDIDVALEKIEGATRRTYSPKESGNYIVEVYNDNECSTMSDRYQFVYNGINNVIADKISVYPNPAKDFIELKEIKDIEWVKAISTNGTEYKLNRINKTKVDIRTLSNGLYILLVQTEKGDLFSTKFVKM